MDNVYIISKTETHSKKEQDFSDMVIRCMCRHLMNEQGLMPVAPSIYFSQFMTDSGLDRYRTSLARLELMDKCSAAVLVTVDDEITPGMEIDWFHFRRKGIPVTMKRLTKAEARRMVKESGL